MAKIKILYVDHHTQMGGAERSLLWLLKYLDRSRFEPILACAESSPLGTEVRKLDVRVEIIPMNRLRRMSNPIAVFKRLGQGIQDLRRLIAYENIQIIHGNVMRASIYAAFAAKLGKAKLVWHVRDIHKEQLYMNVMARSANKIIAISDAVATSLLPIAGNKTNVIYNGVDLEEFDPRQVRGSLREKLGIPSDALVFGSVAWIAPWKQQHVLLDAATRVAAQHPDAVFVLVGGLAHERHANYYEELHKVAQSELKGRVIFAGPVTEPAEALAAIDVLVHTAKAEPFGLVLTEAMAMQRPVIAAQSGGPQEIVEHGRTGLLVPEGDVTGMAEAMLLLARERGKARDMGLAGRSRVEALFDARQEAREIEQIYDEIARDWN